MSWALILTSPNTEFSVSRRLQRLNIEHLLIRRKTIRIWRGKKIERFATAFPRYIFVYVRDAFWEIIREVMDVIDFVRIGITPARISDEVVESLRSRLDTHGVLPIEEKSRFQFGERVVIKGTKAVSGHEALFQYPLHGGRVCIMQEWLGRFVPVEIDERDLMSVGEYRSLRKSRRRRRRSRSRRRAVEKYGKTGITISAAAPS